MLRKYIDFGFVYEYYFEKYYKKREENLYCSDL